HVRHQAAEHPEAAAAEVRPGCVVRPSRALPSAAGQGRLVGSPRAAVGHDAGHRDRSQVRAATLGDPWLCRGRRRPRHLGDNGWANPEPAWWLNLQANPEATVELVGGERRARARAAAGEERDRLWARWRDYEPKLD